MEISKRRKIRGLEEWKIEKGNGKRQGRDTRQRHSGMTEGQTRHRIATGAKPPFTKPATWVRNDDTSVPVGSCLAEPVEASRSCKCSRSSVCHAERSEASRRSERTIVFGEESRNNVRRNAAFTLVELVIVIAIVIVLSVVSVPIYRSYVDKAKTTEGYALIGTIISAQKAYYSEYGNFYGPGGSRTSNIPVLGIDLRGNKYFTAFAMAVYDANTAKNFFRVSIWKPTDIGQEGTTRLKLDYSLTSGATIYYSNDAA